MIFLNDMLLILPDLVFKFPLGLVYDKCYPLHTKTTLFVLVLVIVNP